MRVLLAPDKFKGSLTANQVCEAISLGIHDFDRGIEVVSHPLADGGEGTSDLLESILQLERVPLTVSDPLSRPIASFYLRNQKVAFIEMANASGLPLLKPEERSAMLTTTFGTGEMIAHALNGGVSTIYLMIGGSATNDGGTGVASALGYRFVTENKDDFPGNGALLNEIQLVISDGANSRIGEVQFTVLCDVQNPLYGPNGAAHVYAPQKGANDGEVELLDDGLKNLAKVLDNGFEVVPGAGAAGGMGYGAMSFLGARLKSGIKTVMEITGFDRQLDNTDLIITGEGKMDLQTIEGKVIAGVSQKAQLKGIPLAVICGIVEGKEKIQQQIQAAGVFPLVTGDLSSEYAMKNAFPLVRQRAFELMKEYVREVK